MSEDRTDTLPEVEELLPCPFCEGRATITRPPFPFTVYCPDCEAYGPDADNLAEAILLWNTRASDQLQRDNAALREDVLAFAAPWAVEWARMNGLPNGHLHATHYDILAKCGARMDDFTRSTKEQH